MKILEARGVETVSRRFYAREDHRDEDSTLFFAYVAYQVLDRGGEKFVFCVPSLGCV